jgi:lipopolysaccharide export system protein LptA
MPLSIHRLRIWLLVGAALLVLVIAGFLGYARYRTHRFLAGLPAKLGIDIRRETNGYTYSQSVKGKKIMTLHAAKAVEHVNGKLTLHDVGMILYGRSQDRMDRISGSEFEYDQATGVVRAVGEVHIDLEAPSHAVPGHGAPTTKPAITIPAGPDEESKRTIHVKTSGLVYLQKLGVAATDQDVEFRFGGMTGHATGAEYNSDTGVLILQAAVKANGLQHGRPVVLTASHAELERSNQRALLTQANYVSPDQAVRGDHAIVHLRGDGSPERIEAEGNVVLKSPTAGSMTAPHADVLINEAGRAQNAHLFGGVQYDHVTSLREGKGHAEDARIVFDAAGSPANIMLNGTVHINERSRATEAAASPWTVRDATAAKMTFGLVNDGTGRHTELRDAEASGAAHLTLVAAAGTPIAATSELAGETLRGRFTGEGKTAQISGISGTGHTSLRRLSGQGAEQTSTGDTLEVTLRPAAKRTASAKQTGGEEIAKAVQTGHVVLTSRPAPKSTAKAKVSGATSAEAPAAVPAIPATTRATADLGVYDGDADHLTLTGHALVTEDASTVSAEKIVLEHVSGDATAEGVVKATYLQPNATEPVHVLADRGQLLHDSGMAIFHGAAGKPARLWQGASQVEAPVIELDQAKRSLNAHGNGTDAAAAPVHTVLVGGNAAKPGVPSRPSVIRIASGTMAYSDIARRVDFAGGVKVDDADNVLRARQATAYLQPAPTAGSGASKKSPPKDTSAGVLFGGSVERIVASGTIQIDQPGRRAVGEQLVYTASDGIFVLTGTPSALPKLTDQVQGTVTGTSLRFHTGDDSVMVTGALNNPSQRVHTVTRVKEK